MQWVLTGLLIAVAAGVVGWTGWLLRRLFTVAAAPSGDPAPDAGRGEEESA